MTVQTIQNASLDGVVATKQSFDAYKQSADSVERTLRQLDEEVHRFRVRIGLPNQDDEVLDSSQPRELAGINYFVPSFFKQSCVPRSINAGDLQILGGLQPFRHIKTHLRPCKSAPSRV